MRGGTRAAIGTLAALGLLAAGSAGAGIDTTPSVPTAGASTLIFLTDDEGAPVEGAEIRAVYRPQSEVEQTEIVGTTGTEGSVAWVPGQSGVVDLEAVLPADGSTLSRSISVRFRGVPLTGLLILVFAGLILYGTVIRGFRILTSTEPPPLPPDT